MNTNQFVPSESSLPKIGMIVLQTDETVENESRFYLAGSDVSLLHSRISVSDTINARTLNAMRDCLQQSLGVFPLHYQFDAVAVACTSAAAVIGEQHVTDDIRAAVHTRYVTNPLTAAKAALAHIGARRIAYLSPYVSEVSQAMQAAFNDARNVVVASDSFCEHSDRAVAAIAPEKILNALMQFHDTETDAVFISCTNLRCARIIAAAEQQLNRVVISSNQALWWHLMQLTRMQAPKNPAFGRLFNQ